jgi:hypothetical protein
MLKIALINSIPIKSDYYVKKTQKEYILYKQTNRQPIKWVYITIFDQQEDTYVILLYTLSYPMIYVSASYIIAFDILL